MRTMVLHPDIQTDRDRRDPVAALEEGVALAAALPDLEIVGADIVRLPRAQPGMLFGSGKIEELKVRIEADEVGLVLIDGSVTPVQQRNLEKAWGCKLLDRTGLILEILPIGRGPVRACCRWSLPRSAISAPGWSGPGPTWNASAVAWASWADPARPRSRPTAVPSMRRSPGSGGNWPRS
jgi:hypothetical protein